MPRYIATVLTLSAMLAACATPLVAPPPKQDIRDELSQAAEPVAAKPVKSDPLAAALLPPLKLDLPKAASRALEQRFDLVVNNAPAGQVLLGIVSGSRYSMLLPPDLSGNITANLKDVTVPEAMAAMRELYGYEYKIDGNRIFVQPQSLQTRIFHLNYLNASRKGSSDIRVYSGSASDGSGSGSNSTPANQNSTGTGNTGNSVENSKISTSSHSDFWAELALALKAIVGDKDGRNVVISPQSGVVVIRALPAEQAQVESFLKASQLALERQVILEAKIIEVELSDNFQSGVNWAGFGTLSSSPNTKFALGTLAPGTTIGSSGKLESTPISGTPPDSIGNIAGAAGTLFGMVFRTNNFAAILNFLEAQGSVHVLSSPRIATLNNQKAVLKVGTDDYFVTNVSTTTTSGGTANTTTPNVTLRPFFSGIALDVTPQIDENANITLHIHPSVSEVKTVTQSLDLGVGGSLKLPLASSRVSETDSIVRAQDGQIIAIGGLIRQMASSDASQVPGLGGLPGIGGLFRQKSQGLEKRELVILLKPTVIQSGANWSDDITRAGSRVNKLLDAEPAGANSATSK